MFKSQNLVLHSGNTSSVRGRSVLILYSIILLIYLLMVLISCKPDNGTNGTTGATSMNQTIIGDHSEKGILIG